MLIQINGEFSSVHDRLCMIAEFITLILVLIKKIKATIVPTITQKCEGIHFNFIILDGLKQL